MNHVIITKFISFKTQEHPNDVYYLNCGSLRERFRMRLNESKENIDHAREAFLEVTR